MKKALGLFFFIHLVWSQSSVVCAAQWPPLDAKWYYTNSYLQTNTISYSTVETVKDTIVGTSACRVIAERFGGYRQDVSYIVKRNNDSIFLYNADKSFSLLYNFAAQKGESYTTGYLKADGKPLVVYVDSVKQIVLNGKSKRVQYVHSGDGFTIDFGGVVIEDIGNTTSFFPQLEMGHYGPLRCYSDAAMGNVKNPYYPANESKWNRVDCDQVVPGATSGQYKSVFGSKSTSWNQYVPGGNSISTDSLLVTGDTIIDSKNYKIIGKKYGQSDWILRDIFYLYETPDHSKVYQQFPEKWNSTMKKREFLVMDLNLKVNDLFRLEGDGYIADSSRVDTIYYDDQRRKHIRFLTTIDCRLSGSYTLERFEFIEGVGTNFGLFYQGFNNFFSLTDNSYLLCAHHNDSVTYYGKQSKNQCSYFYTALKEIKQTQSVLVSFDKLSNQLIIKSTNGAEQDLAIALYSANGTLLKRIDEVALPAAVSLNNLSNGVYIVSLKTATSIVNRKIVINRY
ncbi:MAG: T9SS type A sorting domain-containing protein [Bacteroidales bacterium]